MTTMEKQYEATIKVAHDQRFVFGWANHMDDKAENPTTKSSSGEKPRGKARASYAVVTLAWLASPAEPVVEHAWERKIRWFSDFEGAHQFFDHQTDWLTTDAKADGDIRQATVLIISDFQYPPHVERARVSGGEDGWRGRISKRLMEDPGPLLEPAESAV